MTETERECRIEIVSFQSICRVCLNEHKELISIYDVNLLQKLRDEEIKHDLVSIFQKYCNIGIHQEDGKPQKICINCVLQLQESFNFFELFVRSNEYLNEILFKSNTEPLKIEVEVEELKFYIDEDINSLEDKQPNSSTSDHAPDANKVEYKGIDSSSKQKQCGKKIQTQFKSGEKFTCLPCKQVFTDINSIIDHCDESHKTTKICIICNKPYTKRLFLKYHMSQHSKKAIRCKPCRLYFQNEALKNEHLRKYDHSNPLVCHICGKKFTKEHRRKTHMIAHFGEKDYKCNLCNTTFKYKNSYTRHYSTHFGKRFLCYVCGKAFTTNLSMKLHIKQKHENNENEKKGQGEGSIRPYKRRTTVSQECKCEYCEEVFSSKIGYTRHKQAHKEFSDYRCRHCKETFSTREERQIHINVHNRYTCSFCGKGFYYKSALNMHLVVSHKKELESSRFRFSCTICGLPQSSGKVLEKHMLTHTGEKPWVCEVCGKSFRQVSHLKIHMYQHTGKKPHKCEICGKAFSFRANVVSHMRIHTGERPYPCPYCDKSFRDSTILHKHKKKKHPELFETETEDL